MVRIVKTGRGIAAAFATFILSAGCGHAAIEISTKPTANMTCSGSVCTPTAKKAVLNVIDLANMLASGDVAIKSDTSSKDIEIDAALSWTSTQRLTLDAYHSIAFNKPVVVAGTGAMTITTNDGGSGGDFRFFGKGRVKFWDLKSSLNINGNAYILEKNIKALKGAIRYNGRGNFALADNINAKGRVYWNSPIPSFGGNFEGLGNTISNLSIDDETSKDNVGFFGWYDAEGSPPSVAIHDVKLSNVSISGFGVEQNIGSLVGYLLFGTVKNSQASGQVSGDGASSKIGGLIGNSTFSSISGSSASVTVSGSGNAAASGGLVGNLEGECGDGCAWTLTDSFASGSVLGSSGVRTGGLVGYNFGGIVTNSYAIGTVTAGQNANAGGLIGENSDNSGYRISPILIGNYSLGNVSGDTGAVVGGLIGSDASDARNSDLYWDLDTSNVNDSSRGAGNITDDPGITGLSDAQLKSGLPSGFDKKVWKQSAAINNGYPYLIDNPPQ